MSNVLALKWGAEEFQASTIFEEPGRACYYFMRGAWECRLVQERIPFERWGFTARRVCRGTFLDPANSILHIHPMQETAQEMIDTVRRQMAAWMDDPS